MRDVPDRFEEGEFSFPVKHKMSPVTVTKHCAGTKSTWQGDSRTSCWKPGNVVLIDVMALP